MKNFVKRLLRRDFAQLLDSESPSYSAIINRAARADLKGKSREAVKYWASLFILIGDCLRYSWHCGATGNTSWPMARVTLPEKLNRAERWLANRALQTGFKIGERARHSKPPRAHTGHVHQTVEAVLTGDQSLL